MTKKAFARSSQALVPMVQSQSTALASIPESEIQEFEKNFRTRLENNHLEYPKGLLLSRFGAMGVPAAAAAAGVYGSIGLSVFVGVVLGLPWLACVAMGTDVVQSAHSNANYLKRYLGNDLIESTLKSRQRTHKQQKEQMLELAEDHLARGDLLSMEDVAWLANIKAEQLAEASDKLAITVLQVRKLLAYSRDPEHKAEKPATFAAFDFDPMQNQPRLLIRRKLLKADVKITEDAELVKLKFESNEMQPAPGGWGSFFRLMVPGFNGGIARNYKNVQVPKIVDADQSLRPAADFAAALEAYEADNPPLDLPAMRGWKHNARKVLSGPGRIF